MTNREYLGKLLSDPDWPDDGGASFESMVVYHVGCPYYCGNPKAHCHNDDSFVIDEWGQCLECKMEWLVSEVTP